MSNSTSDRPPWYSEEAPPAPDDTAQPPPKAGGIDPASFIAAGGDPDADGEEVEIDAPSTLENKTLNDPVIDDDDARDDSWVADLVPVSMPPEWTDDDPPPEPLLLGRYTKGATCKDSGKTEHDEDQIRPLMRRGKVALLVAPGGTGKSYALIQMAVAIATKKPWLDTFPVVHPGPVLLIFGEEDAGEARRRIRKVCRALGLGEKQRKQVRDRVYVFALAGLFCNVLDAERRTELYKTWSRSRMYVARTRLAHKLREMVHAKAPNGEPWAAVLMDPATRFMPAEAETDNYTATRFIGWAESLTKPPEAEAATSAEATDAGSSAEATETTAAPEPGGAVAGQPTPPTGTVATTGADDAEGEHIGPAVVIAHHTRKPGANKEQSQYDARGSSALTDGARLQIGLAVKWEAIFAKRFVPGKDGQPAKYVTENTRKPRRLVELQITKTNYASLEDPIFLDPERYRIDNGGVLGPAKNVVFANVHDTRKAAITSKDKAVVSKSAADTAKQGSDGKHNETRDDDDDP